MNKYKCLLMWLLALIRDDVWVSEGSIVINGRIHNIYLYTRPTKTFVLFGSTMAFTEEELRQLRVSEPDSHTSLIDGFAAFTLFAVGTRLQVIAPDGVALFRMVADTFLGGDATCKVLVVETVDTWPGVSDDVLDAFIMAALENGVRVAFEDCLLAATARRHGLIRAAPRVWRKDPPGNPQSGLK